MHRETKKCHIYMALWCLYWLQGTLFTTGGVISQGILAFLLMVSMYFFFVTIFRYKLPKVMNTMTLMVIVFMVYGAVSIAVGEKFKIEATGYNISAFGYLKDILISFLPIYTIYYATKKRYFQEEDLRRWTLIFLGVSIIGFYHNQLEIMASSNKEEITNNGAYPVLACLILLPLFNRKPLTQYLILAICMIYALVGMKRGALVCGAIATVWFLFYKMHTEKKKKRGGIILLTAAIVIVSVYAFRHMMDTSDYFNDRMEDTLSGETSGRDDLYVFFFYYFISETSPMRFLFGNGANATLDIGPNYAHNDWLEIAINNGLVMIIIYCIYWIQMLNIIKRSKDNKIVYMMISLFFIIFFPRTFFSMSYSAIPTWASAGLGFALANYSGKNTRHVYQIQSGRQRTI